MPDSSIQPNTGLAWRALKVRTGSESLAASALINRGHEPFLALYEERRRYSDRVKKVQTPAFPGYIFCKFDLRDKVAVLSSPAVLYAVSCFGSIAAVPEEEIEAIRKAIECGGRPAPYPQVGDRVRIECGPLAGIEGLLTRTDGEDRLVLSVHLIQRSVAVRVDADQVSLVRKPTRPATGFDHGTRQPGSGRK